MGLPGYAAAVESAGAPPVQGSSSSSPTPAGSSTPARSASRPASWIRTISSTTHGSPARRRSSTGSTATPPSSATDHDRGAKPPAAPAQRRRRDSGRPRWRTPARGGADPRSGSGAPHRLPERHAPHVPPRHRVGVRGDHEVLVVARGLHADLRLRSWTRSQKRCFGASRRLKRTTTRSSGIRSRSIACRSPRAGRSGRGARRRRRAT